MTDDIYAAPESEVSSPRKAGEFGSLERAVQGDYEFSIGAVLSEAWAKTQGSKGTILLACGIYFLLLMVVSFGVDFILDMLGLSPSVEPGVQAEAGPIALSVLVQNIAIFAITTPVSVGIAMLAFRRSMDAPLSASSVMGYYNKTLPLFITVVLMYILMMVGFLLFVLPGIYLMLAYYMALPLVVEKGLSPWQALEASRKAVGKRWFSVFGLFLLISLINAVGLLLLGIGLIWTVPMSVIAYGILYRNMFGVEAATLAG